MKFPYIKSFWIFLGLIVIDQLSKYIIRHVGGFYICNSNLAFGMRPIYIILLFAALIIFLSLEKKKTSQASPIYHQLPLINNYKWLINNWLLIILVTSGALSNLIDRIIFGCVIDFIDLRFWPVFNLADTFIFSGGIILLAKLLREEKNV